MLQRNQDKCFLLPVIKLKCSLAPSEKYDSKKDRHAVKKDSQAVKKTQKERFKIWTYVSISKLNTSAFLCKGFPEKKSFPMFYHVSDLTGQILLSCIKCCQIICQEVLIVFCDV